MSQEQNQSKIEHENKGGKGGQRNEEDKLSGIQYSNDL